MEKNCFDRKYVDQKLRLSYKSKLQNYAYNDL